MTPDRASRTAEYVAFIRAIESARPAERRILDDPFATCFLRPALRRAVRFSRVPLIGSLIPWYLDRRIPGAGTSGVARTRLIDEALTRAVEDGLRQVVILGAGFDCRAYRIGAMRSAAVFEVDHPATLAVKRRHLRHVLPDLPDHVRFVETDFNRETLAATLTRAAFDPSRPAVFLWEGVTNYLTAEAVDEVLRFVAGAARRTRLIFTYVDARALDGSGLFPDAAATLRAVAGVGEPWTFGLLPAELSRYLRDRGLGLDWDSSAHDYRVQCFGPAGAHMKGYDFYHLAVARVADA